MPEITYELIAPLVAQVDVTGHSTTVIFRCPVSGAEVRSGASITQRQGGAGAAVKSSIWRNMRWSLSRMVRSVFGYGVAGQLGSAVADTAMHSTGSGGFKPSEAQIKQAVIDAYKSVSNQFAWDTSNQRLVAASVFRELQTEFANVVQQTTFTKPWDRNILARMLTEVAVADGKIDEEERELFFAFIGQDGPTIDELAAKPPLTPAELQETSAEVRQTMLLLTTAMAMANESFTVQERERVHQLAQGLGIAGDAVARAQELAADFLVDQALDGAYADGELADDERRKIDLLAAKLQVAPERVQRLDARCRKRKGLL